MSNVINDYTVILSGTDYNSPECRRFHLQGRVGTDNVTTSPIVYVKGRVVVTRSGTTYILGKRGENSLSFADIRKKYPYVPLA